MRTHVLLPAPYIACPIASLRTGYRYLIPISSVFWSGTLCFSIRSVGFYGLWFVPLAQPWSTSWNTLWKSQGTSSAVLPKRRVPKCRSPKYEMAMGCRSTSTPLEAPCASQHVVGTVCTSGCTSCNLPSLLASNTLCEWPLMREIGHRCGYHIFVESSVFKLWRIQILSVWWKDGGAWCCWGALE